MELRKLKLESKDGKIIRTFQVQSEKVHLIHRADSRRLELVPEVSSLDDKNVSYKEYGQFTGEQLSTLKFEIPGLGFLTGFEEGALQKDVALEEPEEKIWWLALVVTMFAIGGFMTFLLNQPIETAERDAELKQEVVKIVKSIPVTPKKPNAQAANMNPTAKVAPAKDAVRRQGALAVLGSLNSGKQKGGLNLGAAQTTAGPGLGGNAGSGGVQTTLYGKGLVSAPLGAGGNIQGGGGYGTKGKGGGQAGYGSLSLVGSSGASPVPLGKEAIVGGGLDRDLIADVINRNLGQVRFCYEQGLQSNPGLAGRVAVSFVIGGNGVVKSAGIESTSLNAKSVEDCIVGRLRSWKFPLPEGGVDVKVSYPFNLRRAGQG
ncbi:MAG: AgmX/PglI C-terminal domain-containing protein [Pseudobdellovibrionaceae bacterium]